MWGDPVMHKRPPGSSWSPLERTPGCTLVCGFDVTSNANPAPPPRGGRWGATPVTSPTNDVPAGGASPTTNTSRSGRSPEPALVRGGGP
eukprot:3024441-Prymnesium_polylepis.1